MKTNVTYNVLWFDDDFKPISSTENYHEKYKREQFQKKDVAKATDFCIKVEGVWNLEDFEDKIKNYKNYQAVIFDLKGLEGNNVSNDDVMHTAYDKIMTLPNIEIFVYSNNIEDPYFGYRVGKLRNKGHAIDKDLRSEPLFKKIREVLDNNLHYYKNHEECLALFNEGILRQDNRPHMDELLIKFETKDSLYSPYNSMRQILEDMLNKLQDYGIIRIADNGDKFETFNLKMKYLSEDFYFKKNNEGKSVLDYENPKVHFELCRREIKYVMKFLKDITNHYSHFLDKNKNYLMDYDKFGCNLLVQQSTYQAFFAAMKWYYSFMHGRPHKALGPFPVEKDEQGYFHCGKDYSINTTTLRENCINVGDFVYILWSVPNKNQNTQMKYRFYAKQIEKIAL